MTKQDYIHVREAPPQADFSADPTSGDAPLVVQFTDQSTGDPTGWAWYFGDEALSGAWEEMTNIPGWSGRLRHASVVLPDGRIVLMGGDEGGNDTNDVWYSSDGGEIWSELNASAAWSARSGHTSVVLLDGSILLMGGSGNNDVWRSSDGGENWTLLTNSPGWSAQTDHSSVILQDGSILFLGGQDDSNRFNEVWRSTNGGINWTLMTDNPGWAARTHHTSVVLPDGSIVLMGGHDGNSMNDIWRSTDNGATWTEVTANATWSPRYGHTSIVLPDGSIVLMGGTDESSYFNDIWRSTDNGATWTQVINSGSLWSGRVCPNSVVLPDGHIVLLGGYSDTDNRINDVWSLETAGSDEQNPLHLYLKCGYYTVTLQVYNAEGVSRNSQQDYIFSICRNYMPLILR